MDSSYRHLAFLLSLGGIPLACTGDDTSSGSNTDATTTTDPTTGSTSNSTTDPTATATTGDFTDSGAVTVGGMTQLNAAAGAIDVDQLDSAGSIGLTAATTASPKSGCGTPITALSKTPGTSSTTSSISFG